MKIMLNKARKYPIIYHIVDMYVSSVDQCVQWLWKGAEPHWENIPWCLQRHSLSTQNALTHHILCSTANNSVRGVPGPRPFEVLLKRYNWSLTNNSTYETGLLMVPISDVLLGFGFWLIDLLKHDLSMPRSKQLTCLKGDINNLNPKGIL